MDKAEPYHKDALGPFRKCSKSPRLDRYQYLSHRRSGKILLLEVPYQSMKLCKF